LRRNAIYSSVQSLEHDQNEFAFEIDRRIAEIRDQVKRKQVNNQKQLEAKFGAHLNNLKNNENKTKNTAGEELP
jgi:hypothetical protein